LYELTEGWAITLHLIWQSLSSGAIETIDEAFDRTKDSLESLFDVLTLEVFDRQEPAIQNFLRSTAVLRVMQPNFCDDFLQVDNSLSTFRFLVDLDLFVVDLSDDGYRYHPIFKQFLLEQLSEQELIRWHRRAAECYQQNQDWDSAIFHSLQSQDTSSAAELLESYGQQLQTMGKLDTLANYLDQLPPEILSQFPSLLVYLGDLARLHSRFQEALGWYQQAEVVWRDQAKMDGVSRALRGQARVYLDTVNPSKAEKLLQDALRLTDGIQDRQAHARLYELLAENKLNAGKAEEAERLRQRADHLRVEGPSDTQLLYRVLLRTGRIVEAQQVLEEKAAEENASPVPTPRSHRETLLLLSLIYAMKGETLKALETAIEGTQRGEALGSPFVTAVGYMRQGHALCLGTNTDRYARAREKFENAIEISRELNIPRLRVEAYWGLCRVAGFQGNLSESLGFAQKGIDLAVRAGDEWIASLIRQTMGASYTQAKQYDLAVAWLERAVRGFEECSDAFGVSATKLWLSLVYHHQAQEPRFNQYFSQVLEVSRRNQYGFLFMRPTLLGVPYERVLFPLLLTAREGGIGGPYPQQLLGRHGLPDLVSHCGYQLIVKTLGQFELRLGRDVIPYESWRRDSARQLFLLLVTQREAPLDRDQICEILWPGMEPKAAQRNFKVALNAVYKVLEPDRVAGSDSAFIVREGPTYGLRPSADIIIDAQVFVDAIRAANQSENQDSIAMRASLDEALELYSGEYLPEYRYESWAASEREHLAVLFLQTADRTCAFAYEGGDYPRVIELSQRILQQDNCWERAYRFLMMAYDKMGDHGQVARTYQRCQEVLLQEIDVAPSDETTQLYQQLTQ
jgi:ATP/maltotriose-dependent transcriptional regulator MalT/DNA-binding SARP family transcriptional activator